MPRKGTWVHGSDITGNFSCYTFNQVVTSIREGAGSSRCPP